MISHLGLMIKKHPIKSAAFVVVLILIFAFPFFLNAAFLLGSSIKNPMITVYSAGDILLAWGSLLTFLGTFTLGALALYQNIKIQNIYKDQMHQGVMPCLSVSDIELYNRNELDFDIYNEGRGLAINISCEITGTNDSKRLYHKTIPSISVCNENALMLHLIIEELSQISGQISGQMGGQMGGQNSTLCHSMDCINIEATLNDKLENDSEITLKLVYQDIYGKEYTGYFKMVYDQEEDEFICTENRYY